MRMTCQIPLALLWLLLGGGSVRAQETFGVSTRNDSLMISFVEAEIVTAVQALARHLDKPLTFGTLGDGRVTLETPRPVPRSDALLLLRGLIESHDLELIEDSAIYRVRRRQNSIPAAMRAGATPGAGGAEAGPIQLWVVRLTHARASDVAATVNALYGRPSALGELGARRPTLTDELRQQRVPAESPPAGGEVRSPGRVASFAGEVVIVPDAGSNSLLIRASRDDFELIDAAIQELDVRPLQVLIEVLIAEVRQDRSFAFGLELGFDTLTVPGTRGTRAAGSNAGLGLGDFVLHVMNIRGRDVEATLRAASGRGEVNIVSRPVVLAANNETARILVGSQRPFVQIARSLPTETATRDQVIQYRDVGTELTVHPTISGDGYVMLEVSQEVNAATTETAFDAPVISTRSVQTRLLVRDGQTVVLGGLTDRQRDVSRSGVPVLSSIPLVGGLFGSYSRRTTATELLLFLTPRVIRTDEEIDAVTEPLTERAERMK